MRCGYLQPSAKQHEIVGYFYALTVKKKKKVTSDNSQILMGVNDLQLVTGIPTKNQKSHRK